MDCIVRGDHRELDMTKRLSLSLYILSHFEPQKCENLIFSKINFRASLGAQW